MNNWHLEIAFHLPHHRFSFGWDVIYADEKYNYNTVKLFLGLFTLTLDWNA